MQLIQWFKRQRIRIKLILYISWIKIVCSINLFKFHLIQRKHQSLQIILLNGLELLLPSFFFNSFHVEFIKHIKVKYPKVGCNLIIGVKRRLVLFWCCFLFGCESNHWWLPGNHGNCLADHDFLCWFVFTVEVYSLILNIIGMDLLRHLLIKLKLMNVFIDLFDVLYLFVILIMVAGHTLHLIDVFIFLNFNILPLWFHLHFLDSNLLNDLNVVKVNTITIVQFIHLGDGLIHQPSWCRFNNLFVFLIIWCLLDSVFVIATCSDLLLQRFQWFQDGLVIRYQVLLM